jgi:hypothetical protein
MGPCCLWQMSKLGVKPHFVRAIPLESPFTMQARKNVNM